MDADVVHSRVGAQTPDMEGEWRGLEAFSGSFAEYLQAFSDLRIEAEEIVDLDDERPSRASSESCSRCARARWCATSPTGIVPRPSKPPGCRSSALDEKQ
jgi:hypothetical protein